jgi:hypothetical protein
VIERQRRSTFFPGDFLATREEDVRGHGRSGLHRGRRVRQLDPRVRTRLRERNNQNKNKKKRADKQKNKNKQIEKHRERKSLRVVGTNGVETDDVIGPETNPEFV